MKNIDTQLKIIKQGAAEIIQESELVKKLKSKKKLVVKVGLDPTMPDMHLGHTVVINKLRQFQELGHQVVFLIGDYTACIGDPSGRDATRPAVDQKTIKNHAKSCQTCFKIDPKSSSDGSWRALGVVLTPRALQSRSGADSALLLNWFWKPKRFQNPSKKLSWALLGLSWASLH